MITDTILMITITVIGILIGRMLFELIRIILYIILSKSKRK